MKCVLQIEEPASTAVSMSQHARSIDVLLRALWKSESVDQQPETQTSAARITKRKSCSWNTQPSMVIMMI